ncbi:MAG TPA: hypothetical protein VFC94_03360 [Bacteroidaceae bacterium]|nr:hypothetical protein [Bacteroidaceae bacterium]
MFEKELYIRFLLLLVAPKRAWSRINVEDASHKARSSINVEDASHKTRSSIKTDDASSKAVSEFVFPFVAICTIVVFCTNLMRLDWARSALNGALVEAMGCCVSLFGGFYLASYLINKSGHLFFKLIDNWPLSQQITGYGMVIYFLITIIAALFPQFFQSISFLRLLPMCYTFCIVWQGYGILMQTERILRIKQTLLAGILIVIVPELLRFVFNLITYYTL